MEMKEIRLSAEQRRELEAIYNILDEEYNKVAAELQFTCSGCPDNCCDSYFLHHTYTEWAYLYYGFSRLPEDRQKVLISRAQAYISGCAEAEAKGERPQVMCPLNEDGLCMLYTYRMLVCRTHGVPAVMRRPDGKSLAFPGCFRCQEVVSGLPAGKAVSQVERTAPLRRLALLENDLLDQKRHLRPKVRLTIAEMLVRGAPELPPYHCER